MKKNDTEWFVFQMLVDDKWVDVEMRPIRGYDRAEHQFEKYRKQHPDLIVQLSVGHSPPRPKSRSKPPKYKN